MELLVLLLALPPAILGHSYGKIGDPNEEPFLPIYPVYPYSPKLMKRGTNERESTVSADHEELSVDLYAPRPDAKDTYASFATNYPRDPYYPTYNTYQKSPTSYSSYYSAGTPVAPYTGYSTIPYNVYNSYPNTPYPTQPYGNLPYTGGYPGYYYQPSYYYPGYYAQPLFPPPPPPPPLGTTTAGAEDGQGESGKEEEEEEGGKVGQKAKESTSFMENGNYIGMNKDLDGQSSTYKVNGPYNQLDQSNGVQLKGLLVPLAKTSYRVVSVAGQPVGPDYPLPSSYAKAQQLEELMSQTLANLLNQQQQQQQQVARFSSYVTNRNPGPDGVDNHGKPYTMKSTSYPVGSTVLQKVNQGNVQGDQVFQSSLYGAKTTKYPSLNSVTLEQSPGLYIPPTKTEQTVQGSSPIYTQYENQSTQSFDGGRNDEKQGQSYQDDQVRPVSYQKQSFVTMHTPYNYQYSTYGPKTGAQQQQQQLANLDDVNFGAKQTNKG